MRGPNALRLETAGVNSSVLISETPFELAAASVEWGAARVVSESAGPPRFTKFRPFERAAFLEAAE